jgi:hypothetical protein
MLVSLDNRQVFSVEKLVTLIAYFLHFKQPAVQPVWLPKSQSVCTSYMCITGMWGVHAELRGAWRLVDLIAPCCTSSQYLYPHSALPLCQQPSSRFHTLFWLAVPLVMLSPLSSHPLLYGTSTPAPTPFLSDWQPPTNDTCVSRWLFNNADKYSEYLEMTKLR